MYTDTDISEQLAPYLYRRRKWSVQPLKQHCSSMWAVIYTECEECDQSEPCKGTQMMDRITQFILPWTELIDRSALVASMNFCEHGNEPSNSRLAKELLASEKGLCVMELVIISMPNFKSTGFQSSINVQTGICM